MEAENNLGKKKKKKEENKKEKEYGACVSNEPKHRIKNTSTVVFNFFHLVKINKKKFNLNFDVAIF